MKVCVIVSLMYKDIFNKVARRFIEAGHEVVFLARSHYDEERLEKEFPGYAIYSPARYMRDNWDSIDTGKLYELQIKYDRLSFWDIYYTERLSENLNSEEATRYQVGYIEFFEKMFQQEKIDIMFTDVVSTYTFFMAYYIGSYYGAAYFGMVNPFFDSQRICITHDDIICYPKATEIFNETPIFSDEEIKAAEAIIKTTVEKQGRCATAQAADKLSNGFFKDFLALFRFFRKITFRRKAYYNKYDYPIYKIKSRYSMLYMRWFRWIAAKKYFKAPRYEKDQYYLFPLQYIPEAVILTSSRKFADQVATIESLARVLPAGKMLYVKEHYWTLGHKPASFYHRLSRLQNVRLMHPYENTHALIINSDAVITIASTVGIESLIHGKPTYVLGNIYYDCMRSAVKINDIFAQQKMFWNPQPVSRDEVVRFLCALIKSSYKGNVLTGSEGFNSEENATDIYNALIAEYEWIKSH